MKKSIWIGGSYRKFLKLDENNQHGYAMMKPLPTDCIKQQEKYWIRS